MTLIANPIYDVVFKFLMEDERVAKILLSALLQKEVVEVQMRQHEYTDLGRQPISLFRIDFSAKIREKDGQEHFILIELQKTWLATETLRFRQYLGTQYLDEKNIPPRDKNPQGFSLPMVSIYILGHKLGDLQEPVVYVRRRYLDHDSNPITHGVPDPFIESLTHDTIIVQIPYLKGRTRNHLERLLNIFDQDYRWKENGHFLEIDERKLNGNDEQLVMYRLVKAASTPDVRRAMQVEDEILSEIEDRDTTIMLQNAKIEKQSAEIEKKSAEIEKKDAEIEKKDAELEKKDAELEKKDAELEKKDEEIRQANQKLQSVITFLQAQGYTTSDIASQLDIPETEVTAILSSKG